MPIDYGRWQALADEVSSDDEAGGMGGMPGMPGMGGMGGGGMFGGMPGMGGMAGMPGMGKLPGGGEEEGEDPQPGKLGPLRELLRNHMHSPPGPDEYSDANAMKEFNESREKDRSEAVEKIKELVEEGIGECGGPTEALVQLLSYAKDILSSGWYLSADAVAVLLNKGADMKVMASISDDQREAQISALHVMCYWCQELDHFKGVLKQGDVTQVAGNNMSCLHFLVKRCRNWHTDALMRDLVAFAELVIEADPKSVTRKNKPSGLTALDELNKLITLGNAGPDMSETIPAVREFRELLKRKGIEAADASK